MAREWLRILLRGKLPGAGAAFQQPRLFQMPTVVVKRGSDKFKRYMS